MKIYEAGEKRKPIRNKKAEAVKTVVIVWGKEWADKIKTMSHFKDTKGTWEEIRAVSNLFPNGHEAMHKVLGHAPELDLQQK